MLRRLFLPLLAAAGLSLAQAGEQSLKLDTLRSTVEIQVKATVDSFTGSLEAYRAEVKVLPESGRVTQAWLTFRFADLKTGKVKRDAAMLEWMGSEHPDGRFELDTLEAVQGRLMARGRLTLHGVTQAIEFPVTLTTDLRVYAIDGEVGIDTRRHGLPIIRMLGLLKVDPQVRVRFHLQGELPPSS